MSDPPPARLQVLTASASSGAVIFRRGPSWQTASIRWDRSSHSIHLGQWLIGKVYSDRLDMSPSGNHMVYFAGTGRRGWWTAVSDAPWLTARIFSPQRGTWYGGGAFAPNGGLLLTTRENTDIGTFKSASVSDFPSSDLTSAKLMMRGWTPLPDDTTPIIYTKILGREWDLRCSLCYGPPNTLRLGYALFNRRTSELQVRPGWGNGLTGGKTICRWRCPAASITPN